MSKNNSSQKMRFICENFVIEKVIQHGREDCYVIPPDGAGVIALSDDEKIMLIYEYRRATETMEWYLPAGRQKPEDADAEACARREMREETGYDAQQMELFMTMPSKAAWYKQTKSIYIARGLFESPLDTGDEAVKPEVHWKTQEEVLQLLLDKEITEDIAAVLYNFLHVEQFKKNKQIFDVSTEKPSGLNNNQPKL